jgi:hypothetical protein
VSRKRPKQSGRILLTTELQQADCPIQLNFQELFILYLFQEIKTSDMKKVFMICGFALAMACVSLVAEYFIFNDNPTYFNLFLRFICAAWFLWSFWRRVKFQPNN